MGQMSLVMGECDGLVGSKMAKQTCTMEVAVAAHPSWMTTLLKESITKFVKISVSQFQSYGRVFHKFHLHYSMKLWQRGCTTIVCAWWVPKMLPDEQRNQRLSSVFTFLQRYHSEGEKFLDRVVTGDRTWIFCSNIATKKQSMVWKLRGSLTLWKFKQTFCGRKLMATDFGTEEVFCWWYSWIQEQQSHGKCTAKR